MIRHLPAALAAAIILLVTPGARAGSTINPNIPAQGAPLISAPVRGNFGSAFNDVNNILGMYAGTSAPVSPTQGQDWLNTTSLSAAVWNKWDGVIGAWVQVGIFNLNSGTFSAVGGITVSIGAGVGISTSGCTAISAGGTCTISSINDTPRWTGLGLGGAAPSSGLEVYNAPASPGANGQGALGATTANGAELLGQGSSWDVSFAQRSGAVVCGVPAGATQFTCNGAANLTAGGSLAGTFTGAPTLSGANFITLGNLVQDTMAWSLLGNASNSTAANYAPFTVDGLTNKGTPVGGDELMLADSAASFGLKKCTITNCIAAVTAGVSQIDAQTGAFTTGNGVDSSGKVIELTAARRTLPTTQIFTSGSGTYTTPANALWLEVYIVGAGGGGGGCGAASAGGPGGAGGTSTFNSISAAGGSGGPAAAASSATVVAGGAGGTGGTGTATLRSVGSAGGPGSAGANTVLPGTGGNGGSAAGFGGGSRSQPGAAGSAGVGAGGGGGGCAPTFTGFNGSGGGGGGEVALLIINSPAASYSYTVGASGTAGTAGTSGFAGGAGAAGEIIVIEHYGT